LHQSSRIQANLTQLNPTSAIIKIPVKRRTSLQIAVSGDRLLAEKMSDDAKFILGFG
jgi:hypothetical protein